MQIAQQNPWLQHVRMERNGGFIDNCNHAAEAARGEVLLFLNNDTLVGNGWLGALLASLNRRPGAGVVGSQVYSSDGKLLESGGIIWANGDVWNHGQGFKPQRWFELDHERGGLRERLCHSNPKATLAATRWFRHPLPPGILRRHGLLPSYTRRGHDCRCAAAFAHPAWRDSATLEAPRLVSSASNFPISKSCVSDGDEYYLLNNQLI